MCFIIITISILVRHRIINSQTLSSLQSPFFIAKKFSVLQVIQPYMYIYSTLYVHLFNPICTFIQPYMYIYSTLYVHVFNPICTCIQPYMYIDENLTQKYGEKVRKTVTNEIRNIVSTMSLSGKHSIKQIADVTNLGSENGCKNC